MEAAEVVKAWGGRGGRQPDPPKPQRQCGTEKGRSAARPDERARPRPPIPFFLFSPVPPPGAEGEKERWRSHTTVSCLAGFGWQAHPPTRTWGGPAIEPNPAKCRERGTGARAMNGTPGMGLAFDGVERTLSRVERADGVGSLF